MFVGDEPDSMIECWCLGWVTDAGADKYVVLPVGDGAGIFLYSNVEPMGLAPVQKDMPDINIEDELGSVIKFPH